MSKSAAVIEGFRLTQEEVDDIEKRVDEKEYDELCTKYILIEDSDVNNPEYIFWISTVECTRGIVELQSSCLFPSLDADHADRIRTFYRYFPKRKDTTRLFLALCS